MKLFSPCQLAGTRLANRIVMAPMTRSRASGNIPNRLMAEYYGQRASAGLIITEGTSPSPHGLGYARIPGIFSPEQVDGWQMVTGAVHGRGGKIFLQMMHTGRVGNSYNLPPGATLLGPSALGMKGVIWTDQKGEQPYDLPREMSLAEVRAAVSEYGRGASNAVDAGFDGVEIHGANGYLITQFLDPGSNQRDDAYGGDAERRNRFALDVAQAVVTAIGAERVGIRLSPYGVFNDMSGDYYGYDGPCPPWNDALRHRYVFTVYALDVERLPADGKLTGQQVRDAMRGRILAEASLTGVYTLNPAVAL